MTTPEPDYGQTDPLNRPGPTTPEARFAEAVTVAARAMLDDGHDELTSLAMAVEEAGEALGAGEVDGAIGTLTDLEVRLASAETALRAARALLLRARGGCR